MNERKIAAVLLLLLVAILCLIYYFSVPKEYCIKNETIDYEFCTENLTEYKAQVEFIKNTTLP